LGISFLHVKAHFLGVFSVGFVDFYRCMHGSGLGSGMIFSDSSDLQGKKHCAIASDQLNWSKLDRGVYALV
jgi:hypothetical protein